MSLIRPSFTFFSPLACWPPLSLRLPPSLSLPTTPLLSSPVRGFHFSSSSFQCECIDNDQHFSEAFSNGEEFIRAKLNGALREHVGIVRQIVLLTAGEDQISCRLSWPPMTVIFQVTPRPLVQALEVPKSSLVRYINEQAAESDVWMTRLRSAGYQGTKPSVWIVQGIHLDRDIELKRILTNVSSLQIQGSILMGIVNLSRSKMSEDSKRLLGRIFLGCGFRMKLAVYAKCLDRTDACIWFAAEQLCLSDDQVALARREMELAEELGDEETFEDWI